jgi:chitinase
MAARGYDGIDLDWEPISASDAAPFTNLVNALRSALNAFPEPKLLTAAVQPYSSFGEPANTVPAIITSVQSRFDQINLMTYDLSGAYSGWVTWFNSPLYDGGYRFSSTGGLVPSVNGAVSLFLSNGTSPTKLGIGIPFYGYIWSGGAGTPTGGASLPRQSWTTAPATTPASFKEIMSSDYQTNLYQWDDAAQAAYLSINNSGSANDRFISYDDERACASKVSYARNRGLGGVMIWELAQDHTAGPDPLLQAVKEAFATPGPISIQLANQQASMSFSASPLGAYVVQWTSNLTSGSWRTLTTTNISGAAGTVRVTDPNPTSEGSRFYRVQTPP